MKKSIILSIIFLSVSFTSLINAQAGLKIVKGGVKEIGIVLEYEYLLNNRVSILGGFTSKKHNYTVNRGLGIFYSATITRKAKSKGIFGGVRIYNKPLKEGLNFYFEPSIQVERIKGTEKYTNNGSVVGVFLLVGTLGSLDIDSARGDNNHDQKINKINIIEAINYGCLIKMKHFVVDMSIGAGFKSVAKRSRLYSTAEVKVGYAF